MSDTPRTWWEMTVEMDSGGTIIARFDAPEDMDVIAFSGDANPDYVLISGIKQAMEKYRRERGARAAAREDRLELHGGIVHLPAEFREIARRANQAGLEGLELVSAEIESGPPSIAERAAADEPTELAEWRSWVRLTYRRKP